MSSFFPDGVVPPKCPKCGVHFTAGDSVKPSSGGEGRFMGDREHVDCDNPQGAVIDQKHNPLGRAYRKIRGEK